jgi:peroxiredoxin
VSFLAAGEPAPEFDLPDQHGSRIRLADLRGKRILLVFYPFAFTGVCTGELTGLSDRFDELRTDVTEVLAVSCDPVPALRIFTDRYDLRIPLLSDFWPHGAVASAYRAFDPALGAATRVSYVIDGDGRIAWSLGVGLRESRDVPAQVAALLQAG